MISQKWIHHRLKTDENNDWYFYHNFKVDPWTVMAISIYDKKKEFQYPFAEHPTIVNYKFYSFGSFLNKVYLDGIDNNRFTVKENRVFGIGIEFLDNGLKLVKNAQIGIPDRVAPFILKNEKFILYIAPRIEDDIEILKNYNKLRIGMVNHSGN